MHIGGIFLVVANLNTQELCSLHKTIHTDGEVLATDIDIAGKTMRKANNRGGFGKPVEIKGSGTGLENVVDRASMHDKKILHNGQLFIIRDGKTYDAQGQLVMDK